MLAFWLISNTPTQSNNDDCILVQHSHTVIYLTGSSSFWLISNRPPSIPSQHRQHLELSISVILCRISYSNISLKRIGFVLRHAHSVNLHRPGNAICTRHGGGYTTACGYACCAMACMKSRYHLESNCGHVLVMATLSLLVGT